MEITEDDYLMHYGILRRSGRYPYGSGGPEYASNRGFLDHVAMLRKQGLSDVDIARGMGITTTQLRASSSIAKNEEKASQIAQAQRLKDKGYSNVAIGARMELNESTVRSLLAPGVAERNAALRTTAEMIKAEVNKKGYVDVGANTEYQLGISDTKRKTAVAMLREEGYTQHYVKVTQLGTGKETTIVVLAKPGVTYSEVYRNRANIKQITDYSEDGGVSYLSMQPPVSLSSKRVAVRYKEDGGEDADGVLYIRPGVEDVSIGKSRYAQVRVAVDGTHYLKGMAIYKDDLPDGVDVLFNTNKSNTGNKKDAMKELKDDPENPFGSSIRRQLFDANGKVKSTMNIVNEEGAWEGWNNNLSTQMLSKQSPLLARKQLDLTYQTRVDNLAEIMSLTNPTVKKRLLESFAEDMDSSAVKLKAAALPRQGNHVILPVNSMKETEVYAPNFRNGERVVLIRHPHGGKFEIPELTVNNNHPAAKRLLGSNPRDAIGINSKVAERLSGADFDGDTVLVIPNNRGSIKTESALSGLKNFNPREAYPAYEGMPRMSERTKQIEMGKISNLITDMTIKGANSTELAAAVRHSMVVIDAEKHNLNYKESARANGIGKLKEKYQGASTSGSTTLISRAKSPVYVEERKARPAAQGGGIDKATGRRVYVPTGATRTTKTGEVVKKTFQSKQLFEADDARKLSSGTPIEEIYASHSNRLKGLANQARKESISLKAIPYSPSAKKVYASEVVSLNAKLNLALRNSPLERQAQLLANAAVSAKRQANPNLDSDGLKKLKAQELTNARLRIGAKKERIEITPNEWNAIQAGAISNNKLSKILNNADEETVKKFATPRSSILMTSTKKQRAEAMLNAGYTQAEVADALGVSLTTLKNGLNGG